MSDNVSHESFVRHARPLRALVTNDCRNPFSSFFLSPTSEEQRIRKELEILKQRVLTHIDNLSASHGKMLRLLISNIDSTKIENECESFVPLTLSEKGLYVILKTCPGIPPLQPSLRTPLGQQAVELFESNRIVSNSTEKSKAHWSLELDPIVAQTYQVATQLNVHSINRQLYNTLSPGSYRPSKGSELNNNRVVAHSSLRPSSQEFANVSHMLDIYSNKQNRLSGRKRERFGGSSSIHHQSTSSWDATSNLNPTIFDALSAKGNSPPTLSSAVDISSEINVPVPPPPSSSNRTLRKFSFFENLFADLAMASTPNAAVPSTSVSREALTMLHVALRYVAVGLPDPFFVIQPLPIVNRKHFWLALSDDLLSLSHAKVGTKAPIRNIVIPLQEMCLTGNFCHRLYAVVEAGQVFVNASGGTTNNVIAIGSIGAAALSGLRHCLRSYTDEVRCQHTFLTDITPSLYLDDARRISSAAEIFTILADIFDVSLDDHWKPINSVHHCASAQFLTSLHNYALANYQQSAEASRVATTMLYFVLSPVLNIIATWVFKGVLNDVNSEFFIEGPTAPSGNNTKAIERFSVNLGPEKLPGFISEDTAFDILCAGLAHRMLVNCLNVMTSNSYQKFAPSSTSSKMHIAHFNQVETSNRRAFDGTLTLKGTSNGVYPPDQEDALFDSIIDNYLEALRGQNGLVGNHPTVEMEGEKWKDFFVKCEGLLFGEELVVPNLDEEYIFEKHNDEFDALSAIAHAAGAQGVEELLGRNNNILFDEREIDELYAAVSTSTFDITDQSLHDAELAELKEIARLQLLFEHEQKMKILHWQEQRQLWRSKRVRLSLQRNNAIKSVIEDVNAITSKLIPNKERLTPVKQIVIPCAIAATAQDAIISKSLFVADDDDAILGPKRAGVNKEDDKALMDNPHIDSKDAMEPAGTDDTSHNKLTQADDDDDEDTIKFEVPSVIANLRNLPKNIVLTAEEDNNSNSPPVVVMDTSKDEDHSSIAPYKPQPKIVNKPKKNKNFWKQTLHVGDQENHEEALEAPKIYSINDLAFADLVGYRRTHLKDEAEKEVRKDFERRETALAASALPNIVVKASNFGNDFHRCNQEIDRQLALSQNEKKLHVKKWDEPTTFASEIFHTTPRSQNGRTFDVLPSVQVRPHIASFGKFTCSYYSQKALQFLLMPNRGPMWQLLTSLHNLLLLQDNLLAADLMHAWSDASTNNFDVNAAFSRYYKAFEKAWTQCPAKDWVPLSLSVENNKIPRASNSFDLLPHLCIQAPDLENITSSHFRAHINQCREFIALLPSQAVERYGDVFVSLVFWRWVRDLLSSMWGLSSHQQAKDVWSFMVLARGVLFTVSEFIWNRVQLQSSQFLTQLFQGDGKTYAQQKASLDSLTDDIDYFLEGIFVATLLAPAYARARRQARTLVRIVEDIFDTLSDRRGAESANLVDFIRAKQREFTVATDAFIRHLEGASSMGEDKTITQMTSMIAALKAVIHQRN